MGLGPATLAGGKDRVAHPGTVRRAFRALTVARDGETTRPHIETDGLAEFFNTLGRF